MNQAPPRRSVSQFAGWSDPMHPHIIATQSTSVTLGDTDLGAVQPAHRQFVVDSCVLIQLPDRGHFLRCSPGKGVDSSSEPDGWCACIFWPRKLKNSQLYINTDESRKEIKTSRDWINGFVEKIFSYLCPSVVNFPSPRVAPNR